jgi:Helix-turn-helix.
MSMNASAELCDLLVKARFKLRKSQREMAEDLGYETPQYVSNFERGVCRPPISILRKVAEVYEVSPQILYQKYEAAVIEELIEDFTAKFHEKEFI